MSESMTLDEVKSSLTETVRDRSNEKARQREQIRRDVDAFLSNGGEIRQFDSGERGGNQWSGYNRELLDQQIDADEVAGMLGTRAPAIVTAGNYGKLWGLPFPAPLPKPAPDGRRMWKLPEVVKFRDRLRADSRGQGAA